MPPPLPYLKCINLTTREIVELSTALPSAPRILARVQAALERRRVSTEQLVELVQADAGLCGALLKVANGSVFAGEAAVDSVQEAIGRVGFKELHRLLGLAVVRQLCCPGLPVYGVAPERLWENSIMVALGLLRLVERAGGNGPMAYTVGLLRPTGMMVLEAAVSRYQLRRVASASLVDGASELWERGQFGLRAAEVTEVLLRHWGFPEEVCEAMRYQHNPIEQPGRPRVPALLNVCCGLAQQLGYGLPFEKGQWMLSGDVVAQAGLKMGDAEAFAPELEREFKELRSRLTLRG